MSDAAIHQTRRDLADTAPRSAAVMLLRQAAALSYEAARILGMASDRLDVHATSVEQCDEVEALSGLRDDVNGLTLAIDDIVARAFGCDDARTFYTITAPSGRVTPSAKP